MTRRRIGTGAVIAAAAVSPAAALAAHHHHHHKAKPKVVKVEVKDDLFSETKVTLHKGSQIKWTWDADNFDSHNVHANREPKGAKKVSSPSGTVGLNYKYTFDKPGKYELYCTIHPDTMTMTVIVKH